jgi:hypothetical protein
MAVKTSSSTRSFKPESYVFLDDLPLMQPKVTVVNGDKFIKAQGLPSVRFTSPVLYAKTDADYGKTEIAVRVTKEVYQAYLKFYEDSLKPKLETLYPDPSATPLGRVNKKRKGALEVKHNSFYEDTKSEDGGYILKFRVVQSSQIFLCKEDGSMDTIEADKIQWKSVAELFGFMSITKDTKGVLYIRFNLNRAYVKHDPNLERKEEEEEAKPYVPNFLSSFSNGFEQLTQDMPTDI